MSHLTYRQLQTILREYRIEGIPTACNVKLNSKRAVLEATLKACIKFEKSIYERMV